MTNYEAYEDEIKKILLEEGNTFGLENGKLYPCHKMQCADKCAFNRGSCVECRKEWLNDDYEVMNFTIPADTPMDTRVLVSEDGEIWYKRYFSHIDRTSPLSPYITFSKGNTSWTSDGVSHWEFCKLYVSPDVAKLGTDDCAEPGPYTCLF